MLACGISTFMYVSVLTVIYFELTDFCVSWYLNCVIGGDLTIVTFKSLSSRIPTLCPMISEMGVTLAPLNV
jgi:hypothetical protein